MLTSTIYKKQTFTPRKRRINDNLEQQAQALFKNWFVDNIKPNWEKIPLSEIANFYGGYSYKGEELVDDGNVAMATIKNFDRVGGFKLDGYKPIIPSSKLKEEQKAKLFDILVAHTDLTQNAEVIGNAEPILSFGSFTEIIYSMSEVGTMVDFLKANPFVTMEEYKWGLSVPMIRLMSSDNTRIHYKSDKEELAKRTKTINGNNMTNDLGIPIFN